MQGGMNSPRICIWVKIAKRMKEEQLIRRIIGIEIIGFLSAIVIVWLDELLALPYWIFGALPSSINYFESIFESTFIFLLAIITIFLTHFVIQRLKYFEGILPVCSFCHKIRSGDRWIPIEQYFSQHSEADFTHSICRECAKKHYPDLDIH